MVNSTENKTTTKNLEAQLPDALLLNNIQTEFPENIDEISTNECNDWYIDLEKYIFDISDQCKRYNAIHSEMSIRYNSYHEYVTILLIMTPF